MLKEVIFKGNLNGRMQLFFKSFCGQNTWPVILLLGIFNRDNRSKGYFANIHI